jgi:hypothetical protein
MIEDTSRRNPEEHVMGSLVEGSDERAVQVGQLVLAAANVAPSDVTNAAGTTVGDGYTVVTTIYANDLATDADPEGGNAVVSIGLICQNAAGDVVIAIRGTEGILEWVHDAVFNLVPFTFGSTDDGFTAMYKSLSISPGGAAVSVALRTLKSVSSMTVCGHSLGGALATLLAVDIAVSTGTAPAVYTYGSPRVGDATFAAAYDHLIPNSWRIVNRIDIVPYLPLSPPYQHISALVDLNPVQSNPFRMLVERNIICEHDLATYLYLLSGGQVPLGTGCQPS